MSKCKCVKNAVLATSLILFAAAMAWPQEGDALSGRDLLRRVREKKAGDAKAAYEDRSKKPAASETPIPKTPAVPAESMLKSVSAELLQIIPAESLFCVRVNNMNYTLGQLDQFLAGILPIPGGVSVLSRTQFVKILGSPELKGVDMTGNFAMFATFPPGQTTEANPATYIFVGVLAPVTDYQQFVSGNPNVGSPDEKGVSQITGQGVPAMLVTQVGNYALFSLVEYHDKLVEYRQFARLGVGSARTAPLAVTLGPAELKQATTQPIWVYGNVQQLWRTFGPFLSVQLEQVSSKIQEVQPTDPGSAASPARTLSAYFEILETLMKETKSVSVAINPTPEVLSISSTVRAVPGTDIARMLTADPRAGQRNKFLTYLRDGSAINFAANMDSPFFKEFSLKSLEFSIAAAGDSITAENKAQIMQLTERIIDSLGGPAAFSFAVDAQSKPPFAFKYLLEVKDPDSFNTLLEQAIDMWNNKGMADFYKGLGLETSYTMQRAVATYKGVSINSAKYSITHIDPNSPEAQMISMMYGGGLEYRWAMVGRLCVIAGCGDVDSAIRQLIDQAQTGPPTLPGAEMKAALDLLPGAYKADFMGTANLLRLFGIVSAFMPFPLPPMDAVTKSNVAMAGKVGGGTLTVDVAVPKEHLIEIMAAVQKMQQPPQPPPDQRPQSLDTVWMCPMHRQVQMRQKGKCPICGTDLKTVASFVEGKPDSKYKVKTKKYD